MGTISIICLQSAYCHIVIGVSGEGHGQLYSYSIWHKNGQNPGKYWPQPFGTKEQIRPCLNLINCDVENKYVMEHIFFSECNNIGLHILRVVTDPTWFWQHFLARQSSPVWMVASQAGKIFPAFRKKYFRPTGRKYLSASWFWTRLSAVTAVLWDQNLVFVFDILFVLKQQV